MPNVFQGMFPNTPPLVLPPTYMYMKIFCTLSHTESSAADFPLFPLKLLNILVFVLDDGTAGVVTIFIGRHFLSRLIESVPPARFIYSLLKFLLSHC